MHCFIHVKVNFEKNIVFLSSRNFSFFVQAKNMIMLEHLTIQFSLYYLSSFHLREVKNKRKLQTCSSESDQGCLREVALDRVNL